MIALSTRELPVAFERSDESREQVLLGVIPVGAIARLPTGRWCWSIDLPLLRQMHGAYSRDAARGMVLDTLTQWFEAAGAPHRQLQERGRL